MSNQPSWKTKLANVVKATGEAISKIVIPISMAVIAVAAHQLASRAEEHRREEQIQTGIDDRAFKHASIGHQQSQADRQLDQTIMAFMEKHEAQIVARDERVFLHLIDRAKAYFSEADFRLVQTRIASFRASALSLSNESGTGRGQEGSPTPTAPPPKAGDYLKAGRDALIAGKSNLAFQYFQSATTVEASNAEAWNARAYAGLRTSNLADANESIVRAIQLSSGTTSKVRMDIVINAAKIQCIGSGRDIGIRYLEAHYATVAGLRERAAQDGELPKMCARGSIG